ncbi:hypothetical protein [Pseudomonas putida]|uniref:hypothetical protein n=1 Tax=Pseudomonas putida TaxID=303 RepID=UPI0011985836|nr:hypothetical protein [Pseudomonas putida]QDY40023.1 hypothetical protein CHR26_28710 [Pseudomonas putida]
MPTENRSSNTEMVSVPPYIGQEPLVERYYPAQCRRCGWVGSSEELTEDDAQCTRDVGDRLCLGDCDELERDDLLNIIQAMATPQPHPEPIAWMVGTAFWWTKEEAERDAAATGLPIVGLGPMSGVAPSEQNQGEPYGWAHDDGKEFTTHADHASDLQREGIQMLPLYTHAEPAEVERLRLERRRMDQALSACANERDTLRALLVEALAFLDEAYKHDIGTQLKREIKAFYLSASVEPSAPVDLKPSRLTG